MNGVNEVIADDLPCQLADTRPTRRRNVRTVVKGERIVRAVVPHQDDLSFVTFVVDAIEAVPCSNVGFVEYHCHFPFGRILAGGQRPTVTLVRSSFRDFRCPTGRTIGAWAKIVFTPLLKQPSNSAFAGYDAEVICWVCAVERGIVDGTEHEYTDLIESVRSSLKSGTPDLTFDSLDVRDFRIA